MIAAFFRKIDSRVNIAITTCQLQTLNTLDYFTGLQAFIFGKVLFFAGFTRRRNHGGLLSNKLPSVHSIFVPGAQALKLQPEAIRSSQNSGAN